MVSILMMIPSLEVKAATVEAGVIVAVPAGNIPYATISSVSGNSIRAYNGTVSQGNVTYSTTSLDTFYMAGYTSYSSSSSTDVVASGTGITKNETPLSTKKTRYLYNLYLVSDSGASTDLTPVITAITKLENLLKTIDADTGNIASDVASIESDIDLMRQYLYSINLHVPDISKYLSQISTYANTISTLVQSILNDTTAMRSELTEISSTLSSFVNEVNIGFSNILNYVPFPSISSEEFVQIGSIPASSKVTFYRGVKHDSYNQTYYQESFSIDLSSSPITQTGLYRFQIPISQSFSSYLSNRHIFAADASGPYGSYYQGYASVVGVTENSQFHSVIFDVYYNIPSSYYNVKEASFTIYFYLDNFSGSLLSTSSSFNVSPSGDIYPILQSYDTYKYYHDLDKVEHYPEIFQTTSGLSFVPYKVLDYSGVKFSMQSAKTEVIENLNSYDVRFYIPSNLLDYIDRPGTYRIQVPFSRSEAKVDYPFYIYDVRSLQTASLSYPQEYKIISASFESSISSFVFEFEYNPTNPDVSSSSRFMEFVVSMFSYDQDATMNLSGSYNFSTSNRYVIYQSYDDYQYWESQELSGLDAPGKEMENASKNITNTFKELDSVTDTTDAFSHVDAFISSADSTSLENFTNAASLLSSTVTAIWSGLGDFNIPLNLFLTLTVISVMLGVYGKLKGGE